MTEASKINDKDSFVTTREAALLLGVSLRTIQLWVESGVLKAWKTAGGHRRIPRSAIAKLLKQQQSDIEGESYPRMLKILVVEDEPELLQLYQVQINSWGFNCQVLTAKDGYEGLLQVGQYKPDLIISDLMMPDMDGFRMIRSIKSHLETKETQVIVVTSLNDEDIESQGGLPADVLVLKKPIPFDVIKGLIMGMVASSLKNS